MQVPPTPYWPGMSSLVQVETVADPDPRTLVEGLQLLGLLQKVPHRHKRMKRGLKTLILECLISRSQVTNFNWNVKSA